MRVACKDLVEGCILLQNVSSRSTQPMFMADTVLTREHIEFLLAFGIKDVDVKNKLKNGMPFESAPKSEPMVKDISENPNLLFNIQLRTSVKGYNTFFDEWNNGKPIDILAVKAILLPLLDFIQGDNKYTLKTFQALAIKQDMGTAASVAAVLAAFMGKKLGKTEGEIIQLALAGFLRDCGMAKLPENIPHDIDQKNEANLKAFLEHPVHGYRMLKEILVIQEGTLLSVLQHHERFDGSGFPLKLKGTQLHPFSHLIAIIDYYVDHCLENEWEADELPLKCFTLLNNEPYGKFDKTLVNRFIYEGMTLFIGKRVRLSNGGTGAISFIPREHPLNPYVQLDDGTVLTLEKIPSLHLEKLVDISS